MALSTTKGTTTGLTFPHLDLTIIVGKPTYATIRKLQKELYTNARTIPSLLGGGHNGHLALVMTDAEYLVISAVNYDEPVHLGAQPMHQANATAAQITEANRQYDATLLQVSLHVSVINALRQQILCAVDNKYLMALEHPDLGYMVNPCEMLVHLQMTYGDITPLEIMNRATLSTPWNPGDNIKELWVRITTAQELAHRAGDEITDPVAIPLTIDALEASGVFDFALDNWRLKDNANKTLATFKEHFNKENAEREHKLTAKTGGYHGANGADGNRPHNTPPPNPTPTSGSVVLPNGVKMYYCWSHRLGINKQHTSPTCTFKKDGHIDTATADNMQGGCNPRRSPGRQSNLTARGTVGGIND
jgi:hypothetical protein